MQLKYQGLNIYKKSLDLFEFENKINNKDDLLTNYYCTFESIYYISSFNKTK